MRKARCTIQRQVGGSSLPGGKVQACDGEGGRGTQRALAGFCVRRLLRGGGEGRRSVTVRVVFRAAFAEGAYIPTVGGERVSTKSRKEAGGEWRRTALLDRHAVPGVLVVGREAGCIDPQRLQESAALFQREPASESKVFFARRTRVSRPGRETSSRRLLEGVEALAVGAETILANTSA